jgi:hypothetical protein
MHRFVRLLRLCSSTFQSFVSLPRHTDQSTSSSWLLQESFNTICAATNTVVDVCINLSSSHPQEQKRTMAGVLDLLLHLLTTPQSPVTHLRAVGGALHALERFGVEFFLEINGQKLQHWIRTILSLMNSTSLSVRSIAVDFVVSLFGSTFELLGCVDELSLIFLTVLPEVVAREIGLYSVSGLIATSEDTAKCLWPLRRSIADIEDSNPLDDDRVDAQLHPILAFVCRACQAAIDGVLIELRLRGDEALIVGTKLVQPSDSNCTFDADEESLFEIATFLPPETAPMQRLRWLFTLRNLYESKGKWVEAAETLLLCARTICDSIPHLNSVWRPSKFDLWSDSRRSLWLETIGEDLGMPERGNAQVMNFADEFLEPDEFFSAPLTSSTTGQLPQPTVPILSMMLIQATKDAVNLYFREDGLDELAHDRLQDVLKAVMGVLDYSGPSNGLRGVGASVRKRRMVDEPALRRVLASISDDMTRVSDRLLFTVQNEPSTPNDGALSPSRLPKKRVREQYVVMRLSGNKPPRFLESTTIPTFLQFNEPCICRLSWGSMSKAQTTNTSVNEKNPVLEFAEPFVNALCKDTPEDSVVLKTEPWNDETVDQSKTYLHVFAVEAVDSAPLNLYSTTVVPANSFFYKKLRHAEPPTVVEMKVARAFPSGLSRQRCCRITEIVAASQVKYTV